MTTSTTCKDNCPDTKRKAGECWCFQQGIHPESKQPLDTWDEPTNEINETPDLGDENKGCLLIEGDGSKTRLF